MVKKETHNLFLKVDQEQKRRTDLFLIQLRFNIFYDFLKINSSSRFL